MVLYRLEGHVNMASSTTTWVNGPPTKADPRCIPKLTSASSPKASVQVKKRTEVNSNGWLVSSNGLTGYKNTTLTGGTTLKSLRNL